MAKSIEEYIAEASRGYDNSRKALQNQINAIEGNLAKTQDQINERYNLQQDQLNNQRNQAAAAASMHAGGSGGSFGGQANIANKKYYEQTFVPAQVSLDTNRNQSLDNAISQANSNRLSLESQLAALDDESSRLGIQRYYDELERERQAALQRAQIAAANAWQQYGNSGQGDRYYNAGEGGDYQFRDSQNGNAVRFGTFIGQYGGDFDKQARDYLQQMAANGDTNARGVLAAVGNRRFTNGYSPTDIGGNTAKGLVNSRLNDALRILGIGIS